MNILPDGFPIEKLSEINQLRVTVFYRQFVEDYYDEYQFGHFILAAYAAVPKLLTPDILYKIWMNFNTYHWGDRTVKIHQISVSDLLLSPLVRMVGFELFEMNEEIRDAFIEWLVFVLHDEEWKQQKLATTKDVAQFLLEYHQRKNTGSTYWGNSYDEKQELIALAYVSPQKAYQKTLRKLENYIQQGQEHQALRIMQLFPKITKQIAINERNRSVQELALLEETTLFIKA